MWWILISVIALVLLVAEGVITSIFVLIMLNGYMSLPNGIDVAYMVCGSGMILLLSFLSGFGAKKLAEITPIPLWLGGIIFIAISLFVIPVFLFFLTGVLMAAFGM